MNTFEEGLSSVQWSNLLMDCEMFSLMSAQNPHPCMRPSPGGGGGWYSHVIVHPIKYQCAIPNIHLESHNNIISFKLIRLQVLKNTLPSCNQFKTLTCLIFTPVTMPNTSIFY